NYTNALSFSIKHGVGIVEANSGDGTPHPNPTTGIVTLKLNGGTTTIRVTDAVGRLLFTETAGEGEHTIDLSGFSEGIYFVRTICEEHVTTHKVIKL
ncbi:MAG: T9SS type A sorting domain-containing protein, partial [Bacteroidales bacterium]|nr:T9SS type A sorting domain-containing protein [Bacteroidales bacterium]